MNVVKADRTHDRAHGGCKLKNSINRAFKGVYPALVTPFDEDGSISGQRMGKLVRYHLDKSVDGFYVCGSTGQGIALSVKERKTVAETVIDAAEGTVPVIVHVGAVALPDATALAAHAQSIGASGVSTIIPPVYSNIDTLKRYFSTVAVAASGTPIFPYLSGGSIKALDLLEAIADIPNLKGTKVTGPNMDELKKIIDMRPQPWAVFSGMDEQCLFAAMIGAPGNIGSSVNIIPGVYRHIRTKLEEGDTETALDLQLRGNKIIAILGSYGYSAALRKAIEILGIPCGEPRMPEAPFPDGKLGELKAALEQAGFDELSSL